MGIPSFYKYIKNGYKDGIGLSENCPNNVTRLYLDFNGIIHTCKEPVLLENGTEKDIFSAVLKYVEHMVITINPSELLFISVDGVAPRAKMEQQRKRRYKSCQDVALEPKKEDSPKKKKWDSNAITPGTRFMSNMDRELYKSKYLRQLSDKINVIISNSSSPGEGEQKIFRHIRDTEDDEGINVIHGLDADLFMLSLLVLPKQIYLYREFELKPTYVCITTLANRLKTRDNILSTKDYVLMSFLMGNDFIPKLYALNLRQNALDIVLDLYDKLKLNEKLVVNGKIQKNSLLNILKELSKKEDELVKNRAETTVYKNLVRHGHSREDRFHYWPDYHRDLEVKINFGNPGWRERYYQMACEIDTSNEEKYEGVVEDMCKQYVNGLAWNLDYYTSKNPVKYCDQSWYYPYIHAPLLEDIVKYLEKNDIKTPKSNKQYTSLDQLAIVLPPQSRFLLPYSWRSYILHEKRQYPWRFRLDPVGCTFRWECAPILPKFNEDFLKVLKENCELTIHEEKRKKKHNDFLLTNDL